MGTSIENVIKILDSILPWQRDLINKMLQHEIELEILYGSPKRRRDDTRVEVRANLQGIRGNLIIIDENQQKEEPILFPRKWGKTDQVILKLLHSVPLEKYQLVNGIVRDELELQLLHGSPEYRQETTLNQVRANLKKTY